MHKQIYHQFGLYRDLKTKLKIQKTQINLKRSKADRLNKINLRFNVFD